MFEDTSRSHLLHLYSTIIPTLVFDFPFASDVMITGFITNFHRNLERKNADMVENAGHGGHCRTESRPAFSKIVRQSQGKNPILKILLHYMRHAPVNIRLNFTVAMQGIDVLGLRANVSSSVPRLI